jgi:putative ABC transport system permease protein
MNKENPIWPIRLLRSFCPPQLLEEIEGDLLQKFERDAGLFGERRAKRRLFRNVIRFLRPAILLRNKFTVNLNRSYLLTNYLTTAKRVFLRQKTYSFINIFGLSIGLAASVLIFIYIQDELTYDNYFDDAENIYRVGITERFQGKEVSYLENSSPLAAAMRDEIPEVITSTRVSRWPNQLVRYSEKSFIETRFLLADSNFFDIFNYHFIEGNAKECLKGPNKIVVTESTAKKYFGYKGPGSPSPIGKILYFDRANAVEVTGIIKELPHNTHMKFDLLLSLETWGDVAKDDCWACYGVYTYFKTTSQTSLLNVEQKLNSYVDANVFPRIERDIHVTKKQMLDRGDRINFFVQPLTSIHLESHYAGEFEPNGDLRYVKLFGIIAGFIILIACINFMNLATARAVSRAKEVGVRKTLGAFRIYLVEQFLFESFLYVFVSSIFAAIFVVILVHPFNLLTGKYFDFSSFNLTSIWIGAILFIIILGLIAGSHPAFYLSAFKPMDVLKGKISAVRNYTLRNGLVVFQFGISMTLIICTLVIYKQLDFIQQFNLGFERENVVRVSQTWLLEGKTETFRNELLRHKEFLQASYALQLPPNITNDFFVKREGSDQPYSCFHTSVDCDQLTALGYKLKSGRFFSRAFSADSSCVVINESCARLLGYENFEGKYIHSGKSKWKVIGIVEDFHFENVRTEIKPLVLFLNKSHSMMALRISKGDIAAKLKLAESIWKQFVAEVPFQYSFIDEDFNATFKEEQQMGKVFLLFTSMAIFIACMGLFGLITFLSHQRTKEIGIRKVMGATSAQIAFLLSKNLIRLVIISFAIAVPVSWYAMTQWLQSFPYRTNFDPRIVITAGLAGIIVAVLTVSYKSISAANVNPVDSLKNE